MKHKKASIGILGLGVMGTSIAKNMLSHHISLAVYNRETSVEVNIASKFAAAHKVQNVQGFSNLECFVAALETPRKILLMVNAGEAIDHVIQQLLPFLAAEDIIIDGGNSHYSDSERRIALLREKNIHLLCLGISGGEEGALNGPSLMPSGDFKSYQHVKNILETIAAKNANGFPCCAYLGTGSVGHFVKMVHNGIEYGDMQLLAEVYTILSPTHSYEEIAQILNEWNDTELQSYLLEITSKILTTKEGDSYVLDSILDKAGNKGTGSWSSAAALQFGVPTTIKTAAVFARYLSSYKEKREQHALSSARKTRESISLTTLKNTYTFARILNLHQGFELLQEASKSRQWNLDLAKICNIWSNGCIIKSALLQKCVEIFQEKTTLLEDITIFQQLMTQEKSSKECLQYGLENRLHIPCITAAYSYWIAMTTARLSANMIQAQRDYFGAHQFQKINDPSGKWMHYNWKS